ncbi:MAG: F0F1 ATP synthase subunit B' [Maricaulaceae bacterium]|nr:F0F1 ATP synthase subunit B' [Maricaulaceae bacterium]
MTTRHRSGSRPEAGRRLACALAFAAGSLASFSALAAEAGKKAGMPQLDPSGFAPQLIWLLITFVALYLIMSRVALPKVTDILEQRQNRIAHDLDEAERLKRETEKAIADYEQALAKARGNAMAIGAEAREKANAAAAAERAKADQSIAEKLRVAEAAVASARDAALGNLKTIATEATQAMVEKLIAHKVDTAEAERAVEAAMTAAKENG